MLGSVFSRSSWDTAWLMAARTEPWASQIRLFPWIDLEKNELGEYGAGLTHAFHRSPQRRIGAISHATAVFRLNEVAECAQPVRQVAHPG